MPDNIWPLALDAAERAVTGDDSSRQRAPFRTGNLVYHADAPQAGSMTVINIGPHPRGGWTVHAYRNGATSIGPDTHYRLCPPDWTEPEPPPMRLGLVGDTYESVIDDERYAAWAERHRVWLSKHGSAR